MSSESMKEHQVEETCLHEEKLEFPRSHGRLLRSSADLAPEDLRISLRYLEKSPGWCPELGFHQL